MISRDKTVVLPQIEMLPAFPNQGLDLLQLKVGQLCKVAV